MRLDHITNIRLKMHLRDLKFLVQISIHHDKYITNYDLVI